MTHKTFIALIAGLVLLFLGFLSHTSYPAGQTVYGTLTSSNERVLGNCTAEYFFGNGANLTGIVTGSGSTGDFLPKSGGTMAGSITMGTNHINLTDTNHGIGYYGGTPITNWPDANSIPNMYPEGPVIFGYSGGALATTGLWTCPLMWKSNDDGSRNFPQVLINTWECPDATLAVNGTVEIMKGGLRFEDGTVQSTAVTVEDYAPMAGESSTAAYAVLSASSSTDSEHANYVLKSGDSMTGSLNFASTNEIIFGGSTTEGSWRQKRDGDDFVFERYEEAASNMLSMLHCEGEQDSTTIVDEIGLTWATAGGAKIDWAQKKFGSSSLVLDGTGDYIWAPEGELVYGKSAFTVEWFMYITDFNEYNTVYAHGDTNIDGGGVFIFTGAAKKPIWSHGAGAVITGTTTLATGEWYHVAVVGDGGADGDRHIKLFLNGQQEGSTWTDDYNLTETTDYWGQNGGYGYNFEGYLDEMCITDSEKYTGNFTPPTAPLSSLDWQEQLAIRDKLGGIRFPDATIQDSAAVERTGDTMTGDLSVEGTVGIVGATTLYGTTTINGATTIDDTLHTTGDTSLDGTLAVVGESTLYGATTIDDTLHATGNTTLDGTLGVIGATTIYDTLHTTGNTTIDGTLGVVGVQTNYANLNLSGSSNQIDIKDPLYGNTGILMDGGGTGYNSGAFIELGEYGTQCTSEAPYIDWHFCNATVTYEDYNLRMLNNADSTMSLYAGDDKRGAIFNIYGYSNTSEPEFRVYNLQSGGTTTMESGGDIGSLGFYARRTGATNIAGSILVEAGTNWTTADCGSNMTFNTVKDGAIANTERMRIDSTLGYVGISETNPPARLSVDGEIGIEEGTDYSWDLTRYRYFIWKFNETTGNSAYDKGGTATLTRTGTASFDSVGKLGYCGRATDRTSYFTTLDNALYEPGTSNFTLTGFVSFGAVGTTEVVFAKQAVGDTSNKLGLSLTKDGYWSFRVGAEANKEGTVAAIPLTWYWFALRRTTTLVELFVSSTETFPTTSEIMLTTGVTTQCGVNASTLDIGNWSDHNAYQNLTAGSKVDQMEWYPNQALSNRELWCKFNDGAGTDMLNGVGTFEASWTASYPILTTRPYAQMYLYSDRGANNLTNQGFLLGGSGGISAGGVTANDFIFARWKAYRDGIARYIGFQNDDIAAGAKVKLALYKGKPGANDSEPDVRIALCSEYNVKEADEDQWVFVKINTPVSIEAFNDYWVCYTSDTTQTIDLYDSESTSHHAVFYSGTYGDPPATVTNALSAAGKISTAVF